MSIAGLIGKGKAYLGRISVDWLIVGVILLSATASFGLGFLAGKDTEKQDVLEIQEVPMQVGNLPAAALGGVGETSLTPPPAMNAGGQYVASKNGTKYYLPFCGSVKNIKEENKVWFSTKAEAEARGFQPAANCPGI